MIVNMNILFYLFYIIINKNTYYLSKSMDDRQGTDERVFINEQSVSEDQIIENFYKKELLDNLSNNNYSVDEKMKMIANWTKLEEKLGIEHISGFKVRRGGLMNDWDFEEF